MGFCVKNRVTGNVRKASKRENMESARSLCARLNEEDAKMRGVKTSRKFTVVKCQ